MNIQITDFPDLLILEPEVFGDERGYLFESYNARALAEQAGIEVDFVQDNHSGSRRHTLRGLHYQIRQSQGKLVRVTAGVVYDVAVDLRRAAPTFGRWLGLELSSENRRQLWIPPGFAHGLLVTSEWAEVLYKSTDYYAPEFERCIRWDDPRLGIRWPLTGPPIVSERDARGGAFADADTYPVASTEHCR